MDNCPKNDVIANSIITAWSKLRNDVEKGIVCSVSGGADSDIVIDLCKKIQESVIYVWFDTGLEYQATKDHIKYLEDKYDITIQKYKPVKSIPECCNIFGQPFISKQVSEFIQRLQRHNFDWEDDSYENLVEKYPKCKSALAWWCNEKGKGSSFNISRNKWLKEFMILNNPDFNISNKCCTYAKKKVAHNIMKELEPSLMIPGIRKAEGGARSSAYKNCFTLGEENTNFYRPIFWYKNKDKEEYENYYNILHSKCYSQYGLARTGCVGCPFGRDFEYELSVIKKYEPRLYKAVCNIFRRSYEYTRKYKEFQKEMDEKYGSYANYLRNK